MNYTEIASQLACGEHMLVGVLALPESPAETGVVVVVGGPQYRAGSHRQFVLLSRALAAAGHAVLRFDYRGMGDSVADQRDFESVGADISVAIDALQNGAPAVKRIALWGLCDGASAALLYCHETRDPRVTGLCLLNPWVRSQASLARAHVKHYYAERLVQKEFWLKLLSGKVAKAAVTGLWRNVRLAFRKPATRSSSQDMPFQQRMAAAWRGFEGSILLALSGDDYVAKEFLEYTRADAAWQGLPELAGVVRHDLPGTDHTFSNSLARTMVENLTLGWLKDLALH